jgi:hypothetical protein
MENIKLNYILVCDNAFIAQGSNSLSVIGIFDRIGALKFPAVHPRFVVVTNVSGDPGEYDQNIVIKNRTTSEEVAKLKGKLVINVIGQKATFLGSFINIVFPTSGEYLIEIYINDKLQAISDSIYIG